jgi:hypothetical protein
MKSKAPPTRRKFTGPWDRIDYLYRRVLYWLYDRGRASKARAFARPLKALLKRHDREPGSIFPEECWSLVYEAEGDLAQAIAHRQDEIRLIERYLQLAEQSPRKDTLLAIYDYGDLRDRLDLLAILCHDAGDVRRAIELLHQSREQCRRHGLEFAGQHLLDEYTAEINAGGNRR